ncbi:hypothetical protein B0H63DRAFT_485633 [Podospora didyma]|uniref:Fe2OG dioxygenase domain-containing protein n=1 Tax=Podospora didyma TaxID=330526 RepID=A0AAE0K5L8_9PEZI|nr:hypothetical protein B0H63DRAFT_485633 [Podospora didyma]
MRWPRLTQNLQFSSKTVTHVCHFLTCRKMEDTNDNHKRQRRAPSTEAAEWCARWCLLPSTTTHRPASKVEWDNTKLKCFLPSEELDDEDFMRHLVNGTDVRRAAQFYPLIFDEPGPPASQNVWLRSLPFLRQLVQANENEKDGDVLAAYRSSSPEQRRLTGLGLRDLYFAATHNLLREEDKKLLEEVVNSVDEAAGCTQIQGMTVSFYPSANFKMLKFVEGLDTLLPQPGWTPYFAQVLDTPRLFAVFVDPAELSFHNFENIVPLDEWVEAELARRQPDNSPLLSLSLNGITQLRSDRDVWTAKLCGEDLATDLIHQISHLDLYVTPLNKTTRGGERFIFHSSLLSKAISDAVVASDLLSQFSACPSDFAFVNYVFRCNRFQPGDANFAAHRDTPYYDGARSQVSKYTLLIYLTSGSNKGGALQVDDARLTDMEEFTCVIFDQKYEHEGRPFVDTDKVFLRTELVFRDYGLAKNPEIASLFSEACYMTGQSVFNTTLDAYAHECFERANSLHWALQQKATQLAVYLCKQFQGFRFLTNGYNYWFSRRHHYSGTKLEEDDDDDDYLMDCALIAVLDYLNCKLDLDHRGKKKPFRALCQTKTLHLETPLSNSDDTFQLLLSQWQENDTSISPRDETSPLPHHPPPPKFIRLLDSDISSLFKQSPGPGTSTFTGRPNPWTDSDADSDSEDINDGCCPLHCWKTFDAWTSDDVREKYSFFCELTRKRLFGVPVLLLGRELVLNRGQVQIVGDKILFQHGAGETAQRFNFAACWGEMSPSVFVDVDREVPAPKLVVPPIVFHRYSHKYPHHGGNRSDSEGKSGHEKEMENGGGGGGQRGEGGIHFTLDFFRNDWMVQVDDTVTILVPVITNEVSESNLEETNDDDGDDGEYSGPFGRRVKEYLDEVGADWPEGSA